MNCIGYLKIYIYKKVMILSFKNCALTLRSFSIILASVPLSGLRGQNSSRPPTAYPNPFIGIHFMGIKLIYSIDLFASSIKKTQSKIFSNLSLSMCELLVHLLADTEISFLFFFLPLLFFCSYVIS